MICWCGSNEFGDNLKNENQPQGAESFDVKLHMFGVEKRQVEEIRERFWKFLEISSFEKLEEREIRKTKKQLGKLKKVKNLVKYFFKFFETKFLTVKGKMQKMDSDLSKYSFYMGTNGSFWEYRECCTIERSVPFDCFFSNWKFRFSIFCQIKNTKNQTKSPY